MKYQKIITLFLLACAPMASVALSNAAHADGSLELRTYSSDDRDTLGLDNLTSAQELDQSIEWGPRPDDRNRDHGRPGPVRPWPRPWPRPYPRPYPPRPAPVPYLTCFAQDAYGASFSASGYGYPQQVQNAAMNECFRRSNYGCQPTGCR